MVRQMRVVSGKAKGMRLKGAVSASTRSTTERVRAAIFNILHGELYQEGRVLDLFAGCGGLGIEALSRGAAWADFVELDRPQCQIILSNLQSTGFTANSKVHCSDVTRSLSTLSGAYNLVLIDPPYALQSLDPFLEKLGQEQGLVAEGGLVVVGHSRFLELPPQFCTLRRTSSRRYGDNVVDFYERRSSEW